MTYNFEWREYVLGWIRVKPVLGCTLIYSNPHVLD
jgi:hypothetical protein